MVADVGSPMTSDAPGGIVLVSGSVPLPGTQIVVIVALPRVSHHPM